jgi:putative ABC transport system permease protein
MLKNYFKIAIAVLKRRKFFTFISLFGISFTLAIVILVAAFIDHTVSAGYPDVNRDTELFVSEMRLRNIAKTSSVNGGPSFYFINHYVSTLKTPEKIAVFSGNSTTNSYSNNKKMVIQLSYTNDQFWDVLQFNFIEGKPFNKQQLDNGERVAVISEDTRDDYFGEGISAVGKMIETDNEQYKVIGVVKSVPPISNVRADMWVPYTLTKENLRNTGFVGDYSAILLLHSAGDKAKMKAEFDNMTAKIPVHDGDLNLMYCYANTYLESFTRGFDFTDASESGMGIFLLIMSIILFIFLLLPTLNLVNINISRIIDRSSEIGVRKAFGASSKTLVYQFIVENIILTLIGGILGVILSFIVLQIVNGSNLIPHLTLTINFRVLFASLVVCLIFGLLSGVYPAWRMSRLQVVAALKAQ